MMGILYFVKKNWTDPVWSKVFAAGIIGLISSAGIFIWSLIKRIPFADIWGELISYLTANKIELNYLTIVLVCFSILVILIPMISLKVVSFQLKNIKVPDRLKSTHFDIVNFLDGTWLCEYSGKSNSANGQEITNITEGNKYHINNKLYFVLTDIDFDKSKNTISWTKTTYPHNTKHSRETLTIKSKNELTGTDDIGYILHYTKR